MTTSRHSQMSRKIAQGGCSLLAGVLLSCFTSATQANSTDAPAATVAATLLATDEQPALILIQEDSSGATASASRPANQTDDLMQRLDLVTQRLKKLEKSTPTPVWLLTPGLSSNVPSAHGAGKGITGIGFGFQERTRFSNKSDGTAALVVGFGDPEKVGLDLQLSLLDLSDLGKRESLSVKLHKQLRDDYTVAVGAENLFVHGFTDGDRSFYAVVSKKLRLKESSNKPFSRVYLSGGIGTGRFRSERNVISDTGTLNVFGSVAVNLSPSVVVFTEWTGQGLNLGASLVPFKTIPLVITPALADIAGPAGDGTRFTLGVGYLLQY